MLKERNPDNTMLIATAGGAGGLILLTIIICLIAKRKTLCASKVKTLEETPIVGSPRGEAPDASMSDSVSRD